MDANQLMFWLKGHFDLSNEPPSSDAWGFIKAAVMNAHAVEQVVIGESQIPVVNGIHLDRSKLPDLPCHGCGPTPAQISGG